MKSCLINRESLVGAFAILAGGVSIGEAIRLYPIQATLYAGDHMLPAFIGTVLIILGFVDLFAKKAEIHMEKIPRNMTLKIAFSLILMLLYCFLIPYIGYLISTFLISILLFKILGEFKWRVCILSSGILSAIVYCLFILLLNTTFPMGY